MVKFWGEAYGTVGDSGRFLFERWLFAAISPGPWGLCPPRWCYNDDTILVEACVEWVVLLRGRRWGAGIAVVLLPALDSLSASSFPRISQWDGIHWSAIVFVCESSVRAFCSVLLVSCFAGDMMVSSTDLQSVRKTRCVFSSVRVLQMFTASSRAICSAL